MMKWIHECDLDWLRARQFYLTASDLRRLVPVTKTGKPRKISHDDIMKIRAEKIITLTHEDCISYGAAARGHILEPYAVDAYNMALNNNPIMYHWDDVLISDEDTSIAFSPDACTIPMNPKHVFGGEYNSLYLTKPFKILEIKSYSAANHMIAATTEPDKLEERWQIAAAMAACKLVEAGTIAFFNPSMDMAKNRMFYHEYSRDDLADEIKMIMDAAKLYWSTTSDVKLQEVKPSITEKMIIEKLEQEQRLNP